MVLIRDGIWNMVNGTEIVPDSRTGMGITCEVFIAQRSRIGDDCTLSRTVTFVPNWGSRRSGSSMEKIADQFQKKTWANKLALRRRLYSLKLKEGDSVHNHIKLMTETFDELSVIGDSRIL